MGTDDELHGILLPGEVDRARRENAPDDAIFKNHDGKWATYATIARDDTRTLLDHLVEIISVMLNHPLAWHRHHRRRLTERLEAFLEWLPNSLMVIALTAAVLALVMVAT